VLDARGFCTNPFKYCGRIEGDAQPEELLTLSKVLPSNEELAEVFRELVECNKRAIAS